MPNGTHLLDAGFPSFTGQESTAEKLDRIQNYLFQLLEELRYLLRNLSTENFNSAGLDGLITEIGNAVSVEVERGDLMTSLLADIEGIRTGVRDAEGNITALTQTASSLETAVSGKIGASEAGTMIWQGLNAISLSAVAGTNKSTITISAGGVVVDSVDAKFDHITADGIAANSEIVSPVIKSADGHFELSTGEAFGLDGLILTHADTFGHRTQLLRIFYDEFGRVDVRGLQEPIMDYNANGTYHTLSLNAPMIRIAHRLKIGSDSCGTQTPTAAGLQGEEGQLYFQIVS